MDAQFHCESKVRGVKVVAKLKMAYKASKLKMAYIASIIFSYQQQLTCFWGYEGIASTCCRIFCASQ